MKKTMIILSVCALALAGCEKETQTYGDPALNLEVTSEYVVFGVDGGSKTVLVSTNGDWTWSGGDSWFSVDQGDGCLKISAEANTTSANRQANITVTAASEIGESLNRTISVAQLTGEESENLSSSETANCYVAATGTSCRFDATVKGNGVNSGIGAVAAYASAHGLTIDPADIVYADLLWEAVYDGDKTRSCNVIDGNPVYSDGYVYFTTGTTEGNAVIAVKDAQGTVLWSWHIWVCDSTIGETQGNGYWWQDRNLGALNNEPGDIGNRGLFYQWGRKDPFLPSTAAYGAEDANVTNSQTGDGSGAWDYSGSTAKLSTEAPGNVPYSVKYPMTMMLANSSAAVSCWYMTVENDDNDSNYLWGDSTDLTTYVKSPFDPCPAGYNVPVSSAWYSTTDTSVNYWSGAGEYGRTWTGGGNAYYPTAGAISGSTGGLSATSSYAYYWTSGLYNSTYAPTLMMFDLDSTLGTAYGDPVYGFSVRCMRIE